MAHRLLTNKALGERLGVSHTTIGRWLKAEVQPQDRLLFRLAEELGVHADLLTHDDYELPEGTDTAMYGKYKVPAGVMAAVSEIAVKQSAPIDDDLRTKLPAVLKRIAVIERELASLRTTIEDLFA